MKYILKIASILLCGAALFSCSDDFMELEPKGSVSENQLDDLKNQSPDAITKVTSPIIAGAYGRLHDYNTSATWDVHDESGLQCLKIATDLMGEDVATVTFNWYKWDYFLANNMDNYRRTSFVWQLFYKTIKDANTVLSMSGKESTENEHLNKDMSQALFLRAFGYFNLVQHYQFSYSKDKTAKSVPYMDETMVEAQPKASVGFIFDRIIEDLTTAEIILSDIDITSKTVANLNVIRGLLAKSYLVMEDWENAGKYAALAKEGYPLMDVEDLTNGFNTIDVSEVMWGYKDSQETTMSILSFNSHMSSMCYGYTTIQGLHKMISSQLAETIPETDIRRNWFVYTDKETVSNMDDDWKLEKYFNKKFYDVAANCEADNIHMRAAEMWLIEAEAKAHTSGGEAVLNLFMQHRNPSYDINAHGLSLLEEIYLQRRIELWGEGFRLFDLLRLQKGYDRSQSTNHSDDALKVCTPNDIRFLYQIPKSEKETNFNLDKEHE